MASRALHLNEQNFSLPLNAGEQSNSHSRSPALMRRHVDVLRRVTRGIVSTVPVWSWSIPILGIALLFATAGPALPWFVGKYAWTGKDFQEILGPSILGAAVVVAGFQGLLRPSMCRLWMLCIPVTLLCRELHFSGTGTGVYLGIIALIWFAFRNSARLQPVWNCRNVCGFWFGAASFYVLAVSVDSGVWKFLPHAQWWGVNLEETMESAGHAMILAASLFSVVISDLKSHNENAPTLSLPVEATA